MRLARKLGTVTYRSAEEWQEKFGRRPGRFETNNFSGDFAVLDYLEQQADKFVGSFDANCYLYLSRAMDRFDLATHGATRQIAAGSGLTAVLIIGTETDMLFRIEEQAQLAADFAAANISTQFVTVKSLAGHDAFLADPAPFRDALVVFLRP